MPVSRGETKQIIRATLLTSSDLVALVGRRVFGTHLLDPDAGTVEHPLVVFEFLSGSSRYNRVVFDQTFDLYAYSKESSDEAATVYDAAYAVLQAECLSVNNVVTRGIAREIQAPFDGYNDRTQSWFLRGRWIVNGASSVG